MRVQLGRSFGWLWSAYAVSTYGTWIAFGAFPLIAVQVLHSPAFAVSLLEATGLTVAAIVAVPLGPWVEHRAKRPVMIASDLARFLAMASVPIAYFLGALTYGQLLVVSVVSGTSSIVFTAASGAYLKHLVRSEHLLVANGRFEGTSWVATAAGPPIGGALVGLLGPVVTVAADALSFLLSALGVLRIRGSDVAAPRDTATRLRATDLLGGWRFILHDRVLRRLFLNSILVSGLIMATLPLLAVLLLGEYRFPAWQYGLAFGIPALGGFVGARLSARLVARHGRRRVLIVSGWLRSIFPLGLAFTQPGIAGLLTVIVVEGLLITCMGVFNPINATERLQRTPADHTAQVLTAWSVSSKLTQATLMVIWGVLATLTSPLTAITMSGVLLLSTPLLLPRRTHMPEPVASSAEDVPAARLDRILD
ncbi:MFS family permease [Rhodococcus sp. PvR044]|jgi:MFS family permease|uniref:MFS transporter n=1 Tax=Rhodococcus TaxID=1827 RepID=UPI000BCE3647|nr:MULTISPECIES: MFS transporter [Rhodococcus]MBP1158475.1 MFS family permease [Rhodococcus sp. PvR099]MCZ4553970.1 MFS transporter [Rhodococcus maanshanensis]PTR43901.1 putative MFS family arabinose efflux permease [Rhodococcus sp. OK611]SNX90719.1 Predicted arabinose efflux permease, MFS family [Rhodococcus sp. OK270]